MRQPLLEGFGLVPGEGKATDEMYTPAWIFKALGVWFDLDVAGPVGRETFVPASRKYTIEDDGLSQPWEGVVWCNPPYSNVGPWAERWARHPEGALLVPCAKSNWFPEMLGNAHLVWFPMPALKFIHRGEEASIPMSNVLAVRGRVLVEALERSGWTPLLKPIQEAP